MSKITVIGAGSVGAAIANDLTIQGIASEIVLIDINTQKARGEALDIYQGAHFGTPTIVRPGDYPDAAGSDVVIITSFKGQGSSLSSFEQDSLTGGQTADEESTADETTTDEAAAE